MPARRPHPLLLGYAALATLRALSVVGLALQARAQGFEQSAIDAALSASMHAAITLGWGALGLLAVSVARSRVATGLSVAVLLCLTTWTIADPIVFALAGDRLTPSMFAHFAGPKIFTSEYLWRPIRAHALASSAGVLALAGVVLGAVALYRASVRAERPPVRACVRWLGASAAVIAATWTLGRAIEATPEVVYAADALGIGRVAGSDDVEALRRFVGLPVGARWTSERYPIVHTPARTRPASPTRTSPDLIMVTIESLRGQDMRWVTGRGTDLALPGLEMLARRAVVLPRFVSNGFPSTEGFSSISMSAWPHERRRIVLECKQTRFDSIAARLRTLGYRTVHVEDDPDFDEEGEWVRRMFDESVTFADRGLYASERAMSRAIIELMVEHDASRPGTPLYVDWKTAHPHMPFPVPDDALGSDVDHGSAQENYPRALRYVDEAIRDLVVYLQQRPRWRDTVIVVLGDHANTLDRARVTPLPADEMVWTGALIAGERERIGPPRVARVPASQVDLMPTLLALVGDARPTATLGRDLLAREPLRREQAVVVRPGGLRLDRGDATMIFDRRRLDAVFARKAFSSRPSDAPRIDGPAFARVVRAWSALIERDRVWDPALLSMGSQ